MTCLVTASHCLNPEYNGCFAVAKNVTLSENNIFYFEGNIPVDVIGADLTSDVAILRASTTFSEGIPLCPIQQFPTTLNEDMVKTYHVPCQAFPDMLQTLSSNATNYEKILMETKHHFFINAAHMHGSSGGVVVDVNGRAVGLITSGYIPDVLGIHDIQLSFTNPFQTVWDTVTAISDGRGAYTRCVKFSAVPNMYTFFNIN